MKSPQIKSYVILRPLLSDSELAVFRPLARKMKIGTDDDLYGIQCVEVDVSHHSYIEVEAVLENVRSPLKVRLPHCLVLLILDFHPDQKSPIGFC